MVLDLDDEDGGAEDEEDIDEGGEGGGEENRDGDEGGWRGG